MDKKNKTSLKKTGLLKNAGRNWITIRLCRKFMRKSLKKRSFSYVNLYLLPSGEMYGSLNPPFQKTTKLLLSAFKEMVRINSKDRRVYTLYNMGNNQAKSELSDIVSFVLGLRQKIPEDHLKDSSIKELFNLLSGEFTLEEEPVTSYSVESVETDSTLDPNSPNNKLYGGALDLRGVSPTVTHKTHYEHRYHLVYSLKR